MARKLGHYAGEYILEIPGSQLIDVLLINTGLIGIRVRDCLLGATVFISSFVFFCLDIYLPHMKILSQPYFLS